MLRNRNSRSVIWDSKTNEKGGQRRRRVAEEIRHRLADVFIRTEFRDPALAGRNITVAEVRVSPDLKHATVFVSLLGGEAIGPILPAIRHAAPFLRSEIGHGLRLRVTPDLHFEADAALEEAARINRLLHRADVLRDLGSDE